MFLIAPLVEWSECSRTAHSRRLDQRRMLLFGCLAQLGNPSMPAAVQISTPAWPPAVAPSATVQDLHREYGNIFRHGNRNAASHLWASFLLGHAPSMTTERLELMFSGFCAVSGSPVRPSDYTRYRLTLPLVAEGNRSGYMYYCCWPCVCDTQDFIRIDTKNVTTAAGERQYHFAVRRRLAPPPRRLAPRHAGQSGATPRSLLTLGPAARLASRCRCLATPATIARSCASPSPSPSSAEARRRWSARHRRCSHPSALCHSSAPLPLLCPSAPPLPLCPSSAPPLLLCSSAPLFLFCSDSAPPVLLLCSLPLCSSSAPLCLSAPPLYAHAPCGCHAL